MGVERGRVRPRLASVSVLLFSQPPSLCARYKLYRLWSFLRRESDSDKAVGMNRTEWGQGTQTLAGIPHDELRPEVHSFGVGVARPRASPDSTSSPRPGMPNQTGFKGKGVEEGTGIGKRGRETSGPFCGCNPHSAPCTLEPSGRYGHEQYCRAKVDRARMEAIPGGHAVWGRGTCGCSPGTEKSQKWPSTLHGAKYWSKG